MHSPGKLMSETYLQPNMDPFFQETPKKAALTEQFTSATITCVQHLQRSLQISLQFFLKSFL